MKRKVMYLTAATLSMFVGFTSVVHALVVAPTGDPNILVNEILGSGVTLVPGSETYTGDFDAGGTFIDGAASGLVIESGIMLTSGMASDAEGPNSSTSKSTNLRVGGDPDLDLLSGLITYDATVLEFDFTNDSAGDLVFNFVFASEEYLEWVDTQFNDVFGFYLDGENIALVPGTSDPITVNTINHLTNAVLYKNNIDPAIFDTEYDGFTTVITAQALNLSPGTHTMKLAIADSSDNYLDAAVFIEAGSFKFAHIEVPVDIKPTSCPNPLNLKSNGVVPVAILGTEDLDVTTIDPESVSLAGVSPLRWHLKDVTTPFYPFLGKESCEDCTEMGPDGLMDLTLKFDKQDLVGLLGTELEDGQCVRIDLSGNLKEEFGGTSFIGEDWMIIRKK